MLSMEQDPNGRIMGEIGKDAEAGEPSCNLPQTWRRPSQDLKAEPDPRQALGLVGKTDDKSLI